MGLSPLRRFSSSHGLPAVSPRVGLMGRLDIRWETNPQPRLQHRPQRGATLHIWPYPHLGLPQAGQEEPQPPHRPGGSCPTLSRNQAAVSGVGPHLGASSATSIAGRPQGGTVSTCRLEPPLFPAVSQGEGLTRNPERRGASGGSVDPTHGGPARTQHR